MGFKDLFRPKWQHSNPDVRKFGISEITDQGLLAEIAKTDESLSVGQAAVEKLSDQRLLAEVVESSQSMYVREAAIEKLEDQSILAEIARNRHQYSGERTTALRKLKDQQLIADLAKSDKDEHVRAAATRILENEALVADIAQTDDAVNVRVRAIEKLCDLAETKKIELWRTVLTYTEPFLDGTIALLLGDGDYLDPNLNIHFDHMSWLWLCKGKALRALGKEQEARAAFHMALECDQRKR